MTDFTTQDPVVRQRVAKIVSLIDIAGCSNSQYP